VSDDEIMSAIPALAAGTGVFAEPAAAASLAGLREAIRAEIVRPADRVVLLVTGSGLKDVPAAARTVSRPEPIAPDLEAVARRLGL
jgi:threonine synthase